MGDATFYEVEDLWQWNKTEILSWNPYETYCIAPTTLWWYYIQGREYISVFGIIL